MQRKGNKFLPDSTRKHIGPSYRLLVATSALLSLHEKERYKTYFIFIEAIVKLLVGLISIGA